MRWILSRRTFGYFSCLGHGFLVFLGLQVVAKGILTRIRFSVAKMMMNDPSSDKPLWYLPTHGALKVVGCPGLFLLVLLLLLYYI